MTDKRLEKIRGAIAKGRKAKSRKQLSQVDKDDILFALAEIHGLILPEKTTPPGDGSDGKAHNNHVGGRG